jgi:enoyl-[acyl-carrier-protein] reductase (NADH)
MNKLLLNNKPKDSSNEEFIKAWDNSTYVMEALCKTLQSIKDDIGSIKKDDFDCPNHYAKLAYNMGQIKMIDLVISMLPEGAKG